MSFPEPLSGESVPRANRSDTETIAVAMSGGVDSSTAAAILQRSGRPVVGLTMQLWDQRRTPGLAAEGAPRHRCCSLEDVYDARRVAEHLGLLFYVVNYEREFEAGVVQPFVADYRRGRTPIPCTHCNTYVKFGRLLRTAREIGAERLATGHYARVRQNAASGRYELLRPVDEGKDQTYFLFGLNQEQLSRTLFPLGELTKAEVRGIAREARLPVAEKPESYEICFVPNGNHAQFVEAYAAEPGEASGTAAGEIVMTDGRALGRHQGLHHYTVGQRRGLGLATGRPLYVLELDASHNRLVVGEDEELRRNECELREVNWIVGEPPGRPLEAEVKIRHRHEPATACVEPLADRRARVRFASPQRAITPGQAAVFYAGEQVLGGGWIV